MSTDFVFRKAAFGGFNRDDVLSYIKDIKEAQSQLEKEKDNAVDEAEKLRAEIAELKQQIEKIENEYEDKIEDLILSHNKELEHINAEFEEKLQNSRLSDSSAEERVGSAMLDVRRYADLLMHETCDRIDQMSDDADTAVAKTLSRVLDITSGIQTFSDKLNSVFSDIISENEEICKELTSFKGTLRIPFEAASEKAQTDIIGQ